METLCLLQLCISNAFLTVFTNGNFNGGSGCSGIGGDTGTGISTGPAGNGSGSNGSGSGSNGSDSSGSGSGNNVVTGDRGDMG